jgi:hypothetical protein
LLYIAEKKVPKAEPFYKPKAQRSKETANEDGKAIKVRSHIVTARVPH